MVNSRCITPILKPRSVVFEVSSGKFVIEEELDIGEFL